MTRLGVSRAAEAVDDAAARGNAAFVPQFWPEEGLSRYSLGPLIAASEGSLVRFGVVAGSARFTRLLVIKQLNPTVARHPLRLARFQEEARIHARVRHPNVVDLVDVVQSGRESWLVLEHVEGATLATLLLHRRAAGRPLELELAAGIVAQLLRGLHAVHEAKDDSGLPLDIVHAAVSPRHVMVGIDGQVKLLDFGMARAVGAPSSLGLRRPPGRFGHLSPELVLGDQVDRRSDVFAAGVLLWEALAGRPLFEEGAGSDADGLRRVVRAPIPPLRTVRPGVTKALSAVVQQALERDPARRFASAEEFALALESAVAIASPSRLAPLVGGLGARHFEPSRQALAAVRRLLPPPLTNPRLVAEEAEEETALALTGHFVHAHTLVPANSDVVALPRSTLGRLGVLALAAAVLAASLVVALRRHATPPAAAMLAVEAATTAVVADLSPVAEAVPVADSPLVPEVAGPAPELIPAVPATVEEVEPPKRIRRRGGHAPLAARQSRASVGSGAARPGGCSPPTYLGTDGIRHFKDHCL